MSNYKKIISELGLPEDLNKRLEDLLEMEKQRDKTGESSKVPKFKDLTEARKEFRKAYKRIQKRGKHIIGKDDIKDFTDSDAEESASTGGSSVTDSSEGGSEKKGSKSGSLFDLFPEKYLTDDQKKGYLHQDERLKNLEAKFMKKKIELEKAMKRMEKDENVDIDFLRKLSNELNNDEDYDFDADNEEIDRVINQLKEVTKNFEPKNEDEKLQFDEPSDRE